MATHADFDELTCTGNFERIYGLPCCHIIARSLRQNNAWVLSRRVIDIHFERNLLRASPTYGTSATTAYPVAPIMP
jgi:hypothetical protein